MWFSFQNKDTKQTREKTEKQNAEAKFETHQLKEVNNDTQMKNLKERRVPIESRVRRVLLDGLSVECSSFEILSWLEKLVALILQRHLRTWTFFRLCHRWFFFVLTFKYLILLPKWCLYSVGLTTKMFVPSKTFCFSSGWFYFIKYFKKKVKLVYQLLFDKNFKLKI